jgi:uncharacterized protein
VAERNRNVYIDLSEYEFSPLSEAYVQAGNTMISDKILFASAHPFVDFRQALETYQKLDFNPEVRQKIMHDNAARLLGLQTAPSVAVAGSGFDPVSAPVSADLVGDIVREVMARMKN